MRIVRALLLVAVGAAVAAAAGALRLGSDDPRAGPPALPPVQGRDPQSPEDPPVVWLTGEVRRITAAGIVVRAGEGPEIRLQRLGAGATSFVRPDGDRWRRLGPAQVAAVRDGRAACVESALHGGRFLALRVFLDTRCGPAGPATGA